jgi:hypothetical protein
MKRRGKIPAPRKKKKKKKGKKSFIRGFWIIGSKEQREII